MALPVTIPNEFANATASIPLSQLDTNFTTLANAVNGISSGSESLANVSVTGGTISNVAVSATTLNTSGAVVFNDAGADVDFRVEGDTDANLLFVDASADKVGIGTSSPSQKLDVTGTAAIGSGSANYFTVNGNTTGQPAFINAIGSDTNIGIDFNTKGTGAFRVNVNATERIQVNQHGLCFNGDTAAANALDDYEEGTWTPTLTAGAGSITSYISDGFYTKTGRQVIVTGFLQITDNGTGSSSVTLGGLPFTVANNNGAYSCGVGRVAGTTGNTTSINLAINATGGNIWTYNNAYPFATNASLPFSVSYFTA